MSDNTYLLKSPRFDLDEEPGDSHSSSGHQWVGAFERVLGDRESLASERPSRPTAKQVPSTNPLIGARDARNPSIRPTGLEEPTADPARSNAASRAGSSHSSSHGSPSLRGVPASDLPITDNPTDQAQASASSGANYNGGALTRFRTNSSSGSVSLVSLPPSSAASTQNASSSTSYGTSLQPHGKSVPASLHIGPPQLHDTAELRVHSQGPACISVNVQDCLRFERSYINHAPCVHHVMVTNRSSDRCALVRLESDLRQGLSFMRRKRSNQNEFEPVAWPSNSFNWATNGGFVPANLRGWRHVLANLENADSFILDPQQTTKVYVVLRPADFVEEAEALRSSGSWPYKTQLSTSTQVTATKHGDLLASPVPHISRPEDAMLTSPMSTPATFGDQQGSFSAAASDQDSVGSVTEDLGLTSPRSAPEMHASKVASRAQTARPLHPAFGLRGIITASSWLLPSPDSEEEAVETKNGNATRSGQPPSSASASASSRPTSTYGSQAASTSAASSVISALRSQPDERDVQKIRIPVAAVQKIRIPVAAQCCRPLIDAAIASVTPLDLNSSSTQTSSGSAIYLDFGDVIVGHSQSHTLTLRNLSEIDCFCQVKLEDADNMLQTPPISLNDADTDETVPSVWAGDQENLSYNPLILGRLASKQIKVSLKPQEPCRDYEQVLTITSLHNSANSIRVVIRANMLGTAKDDALSVLSGDYLDFGDCYGGHWTKQLLVLKNNADVLLDVSFGVQQGYQVMFQLAELAPQAEDDTPDQEELPPNAHMSELSLSSASTDDRSRMSSADNSSSAGLDGASSAYDYSRQSESGGEQAATASELAKTPTHHAHVPKGSAALEPPALELPAADSSEDLMRGRRGSAQTDEDGVDASSVASQAGSRSNSPVRPAASSPSQGPVSAILASSAAESARSGMGETPHLNLMDRLHSVRPQSLVSAPRDFDQASVSTTPYSQNSSGHMSRNASYSRPAESERHDDASSVRSIHTALSQDSRAAAYPAGSSNAGSSGTSARHQHRNTASAALSGLRNVESTQSNQLEELVLRPGGEYRVFVSYRPERVAWDADFSGGRLVEKTFRISLDYSRARLANMRSRGGRERRTVVCHSRTCTSFISIAPKMIDLGEVQVGTRKSANISVTNRSELTARVDLRFVSKVLSMYRDEVAIPTRQTIELKVESFPRRVNETYRKQITVANLLNRQGDQIFEVRSRNVDKQRISFHSLFYRILTPTGSNYVDFGDVNISSTRMRTFTIENVSDKKLSLELSPAHPEDVTLYLKAPSSDASRGSSPKLEAKTAVSKYSETQPDEMEGGGPETAEAMKAGSSNGGSSKAKSAKTSMKGADLKERFLETISVDSPTSVRTENASWRLAQKHSHYRKKEDGSVVSTQRKSNASGKAKPAINLVSALKKGGKGRITVGYGKTVTFKDRTLISVFEYLDLASGPPVDARRIPAKSKKYALLENITTGGKPKSLGQTTGAKLAQEDDSSNGGTTKAKSGSKNKSSQASKDKTTEGRSEVGSLSPTSSASKAASNVPRLPSPLANDIIAHDASRRDAFAAEGAQASSGNKSQPASAIRQPGKSSKESKAGDASARVHFSPALTGKRKAPPVLSNPVDVSRMSLEDLLAAVEAQTSMLSTFFLGSPEAEEQFVRAEINLRRELQSSIDAGKLIPLSVLEVPPRSEGQVIAVYHPSGSTRPHIQGNARKQDSRIFMRLIDFDMGVVRQSEEFSGMAELEADELPVRDLMLRSNTCRSLLELGQPHINFGHMEKGDSKTRKILIQNRSEWALRYCIRKSGSIASGDIKLSSGRYGVVPGYGKREVEFVFSPSMSGPFQEKLVVENVADRDNDQTVVLKANIRKTPNFAVDPSAINFGACTPGKLSTPESFVLTNTTSKSRSFVIAIDSHDLLHQRCLIDVGLSTASDDEVRGTLSKEEEEEIENLSQKLKIASRKGNADKVKKYEDRLTALGVKVPSLPASSAASEDVSAGAAQADGEASKSDPPPAAPEDDTATTSAPTSDKPKELKRISSTVTCTLAPNSSKRLILRVRPSAVQSAIPSHTSDPTDRRTPLKAGMEEVSVPVSVHEVKNQDETKTVVLLATVEFDLPKIGCAGGKEEFPSDAVIFSSSGE
ncbi:hypothetical protein PSEUBRA_005486 [Kalmanozyma brasiliensis GHG001]|uniref:Uncharacterized protein n=1 Tax=Kalmanozyma brasiliensis (strain GHG001) TaxID=1365824 RepID=V5EK36_KALBG|nr:uncharacterized protein PSEUBRA_005486 [Kalmanozyma brasiliensis GHG001]EST05220.1 hypothetical protein PSEUBRA_005486 [Kalmanozyma brasiliensis GHG001]